MNKQMTRRVWWECARAMAVPVALLALSQAMTGTVGALIANTVGRFADAALAGRWQAGLNDLGGILFWVLLLVLGAPAISLLGDIVMLKDALRHDRVVFGHFLDKDPQSLLAQDLGELQYELEDAPNDFRILWVTLWSAAVALPVELGVLLYYAGKINWLLTGLLVLLTAIRLLVPVLFKGPLARYRKEEKAYQAKRRSYEADVTRQPHLFSLWGVQAAVKERLLALFAQYYQKSGRKGLTCQVLSKQTRQTVDQLTQLLLFLAGAVFVAKGAITPGDFTAILLYLTVAYTLLNGIGDVIQQIPQMKNAASRVGQFYADKESTGGAEIKAFSGIAGEKASFSYSETPVLEGLDFELRPGEIVGLVGPNGGGKSTLSKILATLLKGYGGSIQAGGRELSALNLEQWRGMIAYAPQTPSLFRATVRENILMGGGGQPEAQKLIDAFALGGLADREVSPDSGLSGGEKQKISIARALSRPAQLVILDEPTNHLDQESVSVLKTLLKTCGKTVLVVSHDPALEDILSRKIVLN